MARLHRSLSVCTTHQGDVGIVIWTDEDDLSATAPRSHR
jgi:hypothetical protein